MNFPVFSQLAGKFQVSRDGFARDCLLQRRVCKLSVPNELNRVQTLCRRELTRERRGRATASSIGSEALLTGSTACRRLVRAIYVVQTVRRVDLGPLAVGKSGKFRRKRCNSILCKAVNR